MAGAELGRRPVGEDHGGRRLRGEVHAQLELWSLAAPGDRNGAVGGLEGRLGVGEAATGPGLDVVVATAGGADGQAGHPSVEEVADGTEGVVVERGHLAGVDRAVGQHAVPALPDRGRPHPHLVEPRRALVLQQQEVGVVEVAGVDEGVEHQRRPEEPRADPVPVGLDDLGQPPAGPLPLIVVGQQVELEGEGEGRRGVTGQAPTGRDELPAERFGGASTDLPVVGGVRRPAEGVGGAGDEPGAPAEVRLGDEDAVGPPCGRIVRRGARVEPVAELVALARHPVLVELVGDEVDHRTHAGVLPLEQVPVAVALVEPPGHDHGGVGPAGDPTRAGGDELRDGGDEHGDAAELVLLVGEVP